MEQTSLCLLALVISMVIVSAEVPNSGEVMRVSLRFSPDRAQFFKHERVLLSCEDRQSNSTVWKLKRNIKNIKECCGDEWGKESTTECLVRAMHQADNGVYWCESSEGNSNSVNITVSGGDVILGSPVLPVMEGSDVTLHCWYNNKTTGKPSSDRPAEFYKDGSLIRTESTGQMTIHHVNSSDEGFYKCHISDLGESPESWMEVTDQTSAAQDIYSTVKTHTDSQTSTNNPHSPSLPTYVYPPMFAGVSIFLLILGLCLWKKYNCCSRTDRRDLDVTYADVSVTQEAQHRERRDQTSEEQDMYSTVKTNTDQTSEEQVMYSTVKTNTDQTYEGQEDMYSTVKINTGGDV